jgi:hypothetical protein
VQSSNSVTPQADWTPPQVGEEFFYGGGVVFFYLFAEEIRVMLQAKPTV